MKLARWEPFKEAEDFFRQFGSPMFGHWPGVGLRGTEATAWAPLADVSETDKEYVVRAEIPGVTPGDIKVTLDRGVLTIEGERRYEKEDKTEKTHRVESFYGGFCRSFTLPDDAKASEIRAEGKDGILKVHVPKAAPSPFAAAKQIKVE